jgi:hypothetical protein
MHIRDRILELRRVPASALRPHPKNWRTHSDRQRDVLRGALAEIGLADAALVREDEAGELHLIDGHLRAETLGEGLIPVLVLDVSAEEADKLLLTVDPLAGLAGQDDDRLAELTANVSFESPAIRAMLDDLHGKAVSLSADADPPEVDVPETFHVIVSCRDEREQREVFDRLRSEGYACRVSTFS